MKKLLFTLALLITTNIYSQSINKTNDGYTEVVEVELTKQQIHQKLNEWIAFSYKSANDVVQLNTEDKIILKGNYRVKFNVTTHKTYVFEYIINNTLSFSIRDSKYKIDLKPTGVTSAYDMTDVDIGMVSQFITPNTITREEYDIKMINDIKKEYLKQGLSDKKIQKYTKSLTEEGFDKQYKDFTENKTLWINETKSFYDSIKDYVAQSNSDDDDW